MGPEPGPRGDVVSRGLGDGPTVLGRTRREPLTREVPGQGLCDAVARGGVEPPTYRFSVGRSYQLSYLAGPTGTLPDTTGTA